MNDAYLSSWFRGGQLRGVCWHHELSVIERLTAKCQSKYIVSPAAQEELRFHRPTAPEALRFHRPAAQEELRSHRPQTCFKILTLVRSFTHC